MAHIKLDFGRVQGDSYGCDLRNYAIRRGISDDRIAHGDNSVDVYGVNELAVIVVADNKSGLFSRGAIIGERDRANALVDKLNLRDYIEE